MSETMRKVRETWQALIVVQATIIGYIVVLLRDELLPPYFMADGRFIQRLAGGSAEGDVKYTNVANVYRGLGLAQQPELAALLGYTAAVVVIGIAWIRLRKLDGGWAAPTITCLSLVLSAVYLGWYSKDVLVLPVVALLLSAPATRWGWVLTVGSVIAYGYLFRDYWYLVAVMYVVFWMITPSLTAFRALLATLGATLAVSVVVMIQTGLPANVFRQSANEVRASMDIGTIITPFVSLPEPLGGIVNNAITLLALVFPVPVILLGGFYYLAIAAVIALLWFVLLRAIGGNADVVSRRGIALALAFLSVQAVFEPDYGSALRHLTPLLPIFVWVAWVSHSTARERRSVNFDTGMREDTLASGFHG